jgi:uncharacterized membrane protein
MLQLPPVPTWDSLHVLVIHFPIALLLLSPIFVVISALPAPPKGRPYRLAALITLVLGTASLIVSASSGRAAAELADRGGAVDPVLKAHQELGEETEIVFGGLSAILLGMHLAPKLLLRNENRLATTFLPAAFLALYTVGVLFLINTAHAGGRLVHEFGIHAIVPESHTPPVMTLESQPSMADRR